MRLFLRTREPQSSSESRSETADVEMNVRKVTSQFSTIARSYNLAIWSREVRMNYEHDFAIMLAREDLESVRLELMAQDDAILFEFKIHFTGKKAARSLPDHTAGLELPLIQRHAVARHRIIVEQHGKLDAYRHLLKLNWGPAKKHLKKRGDAFSSEHARKITGGRQGAVFHVSSEARERLTVTQTGNGGFAFAEAANGWRGIYLHRRYAPAGLEFRVGQQLTAVLIQTPRGIQARAIRNN